MDRAAEAAPCDPLPPARVFHSAGNGEGVCDAVCGFRSPLTQPKPSTGARGCVAGTNLAPAFSLCRRGPGWQWAGRPCANAAAGHRTTDAGLKDWGRGRWGGTRHTWRRHQPSAGTGPPTRDARNRNGPLHRSFRRGWISRMYVGSWKLPRRRPGVKPASRLPDRISSRSLPYFVNVVRQWLRANS